MMFQLRCFKCGHEVGGFIQAVSAGTSDPVINVKPCETCMMKDRQYKEHIQDLMVYQNKYEAIEKIMDGDLKVEVGS